MSTSLFGLYNSLTLVFHCLKLGNLSTGMLTSQLLLYEILSLPLDIVTCAYLGGAALGTHIINR